MAPPIHFGRPKEKKLVTSTVTIANVPTQLVADFVTGRIQNEISNPDHFRAKAKIKSGPTYAGDKVTVDFEAEDGKLAELLRNADLGVAESKGDNFTINLITPPKPSRKPLEWNNLEGLELPRAKLAEIIQDLQKSDWAPFSYKPLINAKPTPQVRNTIRSLLRKHAVKQDDAIEALGVWGTAEDVDFIVNSGRDASRIIRAIESLRAQAGIPYLVQQLGNYFNRDAASSVLRKFGPIIEKDLLSALSSHEADAKVCAAELLKEFGSTAAIPALQAAAQDRDERVLKAVTETWKTIAFHPAEPAKSPSSAVAAKPSPPKTIDGAKISGIDVNAAGTSPNMALTTDGNGFYVLTPDEVRRYDWGGKIAATNRTPAMKLLAVGAEGVLVANSLDAKLLDPVTLANKNSGPLNSPRWLSIAQNLLVVRSDALGFIMTVDLATFRARNNYLDVKVKGVPATMVLPSATGKSNPMLTPDAKLLFTRGNGRIFRWKMNDYKIDRAAESGPEIAGADGGELVMSPDGKYVAWLHPTGNKAEASFDIKPEPGTATFVFDVNHFRKPAAALVHGPKPTCLAFGSRDQAFVGTSGNHLLQFGAIGSGAEMKPLKDFNLDEYGKIRQILIHPDGDKLIILADKDLLRVDLPKN